MALIGSPSVAFCMLEGRPLHNITTVMSHKQGQVLEQSDGLGASDEAHSPTGDYKFDASIEGFYNTGAGLAQEGLELTGAQVLMYALAGNAIGDPFIGIDGIRATLEHLAARGTLQRIRADFKAAAGPLNAVQDDAARLYPHSGQVQAPYATKTDVGPTNLATIDWAPAVTPVSTVNTVYAAGQVQDTVGPWDLSLGKVGMIAIASGGNYGHVTGVNDATDTVTVTAWVGGAPVNGETCRLHVGKFTDQSAGSAIGFVGLSALTLDGGADILFEIQDSADDIAYVNLIVFTALAVVGGERKVQAAAAAPNDIERYTQLQYEFRGGAGVNRSATFAVGLVRSLT